MSMNLTWYRWRLSWADSLYLFSNFSILFDWLVAELELSWCWRGWLGYLSRKVQMETNEWCLHHTLNEGSSRTVNEVNLIGSHFPAATEGGFLVVHQLVGTGACIPVLHVCHKSRLSMKISWHSSSSFLSLTFQQGFEIIPIIIVRSLPTPWVGF